MNVENDDAKMAASSYIEQDWSTAKIMSEGGSTGFSQAADKRQRIDPFQRNRQLEPRLDHWTLLQVHR